MFLGFLMATLGLKLRLAQSSNLAGWLAPVLILCATISDTTLVTVSRSPRGLLPFAAPGKDHTAHRLANLGLGQRGAVVTMYLGGAIGGCAAVVAAYSSSLGAAIVAVLAVAVTVLAVFWLERAPFERQTPKSSV